MTIGDGKDSGGAKWLYIWKSRPNLALIESRLVRRKMVAMVWCSNRNQLKVVGPRAGKGVGGGRTSR